MFESNKAQAIHTSATLRIVFGLDTDNFYLFEKHFSASTSQTERNLPKKQDQM